MRLQASHKSFICCLTAVHFLHTRNPRRVDCEWVNVTCAVGTECFIRTEKLILSTY